MSGTMTPGEAVAFDELTGYARTNWGWYLAGGIICAIFGVIVLSYEVLTLLTVAIFIGVFLCAWGVIQGIGALMNRVGPHRWLYLIAALAAIGAGVVALIWPGDSLFALVILLGWAFVVWGLFDIVGSFEALHVLKHWWMYLLRGIVSIAVGALILAWPDIALTVLVTVFGLMLVFWGAMEVVASLQMRSLGRRDGRPRPAPAKKTTSAKRSVGAPAKKSTRAPAKKATRAQGKKTTARAPAKKASRTRSGR
jgi:uncharacterized membrane protein HdeD (DUF308 family)